MARRKSRFKPAEIMAICARYEQGETQTALANEYHCSQNTISLIVRRESNVGGEDGRPGKVGGKFFLTAKGVLTLQFDTEEN